MALIEIILVRLAGWDDQTNTIYIISATYTFFRTQCSLVVCKLIWDKIT